MEKLKKKNARMEVKKYGLQSYLKCAVKIRLYYLCLHLLVSSMEITTCPTYLRVDEMKLYKRQQYEHPGICKTLEAENWRYY